MSWFSTLKLLIRHSQVGREEIIAFRNRQLRRLINHAYSNVPYYRKLFDENGIKPNEIKTIEDLPCIPITSKKDLQSLPTEDLVSRTIDPQRLIEHRTSGSSGEPFTIRHTWLEERINAAYRLRALRDFGLRFTDKQISIGLVRPIHPNDYSLSIKILQRMGFRRKVKVSCLLPPEEIVKRLRELNPDVLSGFSGVMSRISQVVNDTGRKGINPRFITVGAEVLTPLMRIQIFEAFAAPVFETYGSHEFNLIAWECKVTGELHICDDSLIVEVLKNGRPAKIGERGEVVATNLHGYAMPFIRYRLGDIVTKGFETCQCDQPFSTIRKVQGRMLDYFKLPGGRSIHPYEIIVRNVTKTPWVRQYQLTQEREDRVTLRVVPYEHPTSDELIRIKNDISIILGEGVEFQVELVPEIEFEPNGKFRVSRSFVNSEYDGIDWENQ